MYFALISHVQSYSKLGRMPYVSSHAARLFTCRASLHMPRVSSHAARLFTCRMSLHMPRVFSVSGWVWQSLIWPPNQRHSCGTSQKRTSHAPDFVSRRKPWQITRRLEASVRGVHVSGLMCIGVHFRARTMHSSTFMHLGCE
jgi:hypothetical protein